MSARLVSALDGDELATFRETAESENELFAALGDLSRAVRERAGESLRDHSRELELERVTTPSLAGAPQVRRRLGARRRAGEADRGLALLKEAVALDTAFAMAWRKLAVLLGNEGPRPGQRARRHRARPTATGTASPR